ncbi:branched-chain amino acid ABC transporter permease [Pseudonocardia petroleophila]|uniref:Branched-chain amino acid ABC transporter permease n=1 Tax=Pseudonocardia petroleophila TaxID=37331 RepID=A0A7G7MIG9_9PSEU|nr:branched-chain amino acid ABC transporter permease [Pseudonocardia petroleophila]QNG52580.1 branched-chain amino acid ABC transporter permease [Pseudonocardia petroleophila]
MINAVVQGILLGGVYALFACGLSLVFGVLRIVNLAHGDLTVLAAFLAVVVTGVLGVGPLVSLVVVVPAVALLGYVLQRVLLQRSLEAGELAPLLVTFGLSIVLQNALLQTFSADTRSLPAGDLGTAGIALGGGVQIGVLALLTLVVAVAVLAGLQLLLARTALGRAMRATSDDPETAELMGLDPRRVYATATALALATVALAGVFYGLRGTFTPTLGPQILIFAFEAVIIGGLGSLWGTLAGGLVLGVAQTVGAQIQPSYGVLAGHLVFLLVLAVRPQGLFRKAATR